jgi:hypothetical protein
MLNKVREKVYETMDLPTDLDVDKFCRWLIVKGVRYDSLDHDNLTFQLKWYQCPKIPGVDYSKGFRFTKKYN